MGIISTDIYELTQTVDEIQKQYMPDETDNTRAVSLNGYITVTERCDDIIRIS